jgi:methionyl-tRNA formyltransferase
MKNIVFCGFGKLGKECLEALSASGFRIEFILTHKELESESVDTFAESNGISYSYKDARKNLDEITNLIKTIKPRYLISVNYRYILPRGIFQIPKYAINIHGSLLPKYRGRTPHVWSIINGEKVSGITSHIIEEGVDTGDIIEQQKIDIGIEETGYSLLKKYQELYPSMLIESLKSLAEGKELVKQDEETASYFGKRTPDMGYIDFYKESVDVINFIRAQAEPYPGAYYYLIDGRKIIINKLIVDNSIDLTASIGVINRVSESYYVKCKDANLKLLDYRIIV